MSRSCLLIHELSLPGSESGSPLSGHAWALGKAIASLGQESLLLHTGPYVEGLAEAAAKAGLLYKRLEEVPGAFDGPLFPAVQTHHLSLKVSRAMDTLQVDTLWIVGSPAHGAATLEARTCGLYRKALHVATVIDSTAESKRENASQFPSAGREDIASDFLERRTIALADELIASNPQLIASLKEAAWVLPQKSVGRPLLKGNEDKETLALWVLGPPEPLASSKKAASLSVCIPYYEQPRFLSEALGMIASQSQAPDEVIVVDDGSKSPEALAAFAKASREFAKPNWKFIRQENAGPAAARNRAAAEAQSETLLFCDADNGFRKEMIETLSRALGTSGADCVTCAFQAFREKNDPAAASDPGYLYCPLGPCVELGLVENVFGDTNFIVRRDIFRSRGGFPSTNRSASEDWQFLLQLVLGGGTLGTVPAILFDYRLAAQSHARRTTELASARAAIGPFLAKLDPTWQRLWLHMAGIVRDPRLPRAEAELETAQLLRDHIQRELAALKIAYAQIERGSAEREKAYASLEQHARHVENLLAQNLERFEQDRLAFEKTERDWQKRDRVRRANAFLLETSQQALQEKVRATSAEATAQRQRDAGVIDQGVRRVAALEHELRLKEDKVRRMQESFSWKATSVLRALRRTILDSSKTTEPAAAAAQEAPSWRFHHHLDSPRQWSLSEPEVTIRGWCFCEETGDLRSVRAQIAGRLYVGIYGMDRPDLLNAFPLWPQCGRAGYKIEALVLPTDTSVILEGSAGDGQWQRIVDIPVGQSGDAADGSYVHWVKTYDQLSQGDLEILKKNAPKGPKISVLMPVYNPAEKWLVRAIESVRAQTYANWELCIADDASTQPHVRPLLEAAAKSDPRIKCVFRKKNGHISEATNSALEIATGSHVALFDHDDELAPHALHCVAQELAEHPDCELIYSDEDKIDEQGIRFDPHFKPDWNPDLLLGQNYVSHLAVIKTNTLRSVGGLRKGFEGSQDWDLFLRIVERIPATSIRHIPRVLYHWRAAEGSTSLHLGEKSYVSESARKALEGHLERTGVKAELQQGIGGHWRVRRELPNERPLVSIIIPTHNAAGLVHVCISSILARTNYEPYEIILVDNRSDDPASLALFAQFEREDAVRVLRYDAPFNYSAINNFAAKEARGDLLCLLNNDIEVIGGDWLGEMVSHAVRPEIGAVGARLYYPDFRIQHAGVITGLGGVAGHAFKEFARDEPGTAQFRPHLVQDLSAVTAACLVIRRSTYFAAGGFDEASLAVAFNDVDFCLKVEALGLRNLYTPFAELLHHESASRGQENTPEKIRRFQGEIQSIKNRWGERLLNDPAYNPNLSLDTENFALARPPRTPPLVPAAAQSTSKTALSNA